MMVKKRNENNSWSVTLESSSCKPAKTEQMQLRSFAHLADCKTSAFCLHEWINKLFVLPKVWLAKEWLMQFSRNKAAISGNLYLES